MRRCLSFKHCLAICVGFLGGGSLSAFAGGATSSCQQVLLAADSPGIQQKQLDETIDALAAMKLKLDKALSQGNLKGSVSLKVLSQDFEVKRDELLRRASGLLSKNQLRSKMQQRIRELQKLEQVKDQKESEVREAELISTLGPFKKPFKLVEKLSDVKFPTKFGPAIPPAYSFVFLQEQNAVIMLNKFLSPARFDLETGKVTKLLEFGFNDVTQVSADQKTLYVLTAKAKLNSYNLADMSLKDSIQLISPRPTAKVFERSFEFSPSGNEVLIRDETRLENGLDSRIYRLFDIHTGKRIPWQGIRGNVNYDAGGAGFVSPSEIAFSAETKGKILIYNFQTGARRIEGEKGDADPLYNFLISKDHQRISYLQGKNLFTRVIGQEKPMASREQEIAKYRKPVLKPFMSGSMTDYLALTWRNGIEILDQSNLSTVFNFEDRYSQTSLQNGKCYIETLGAVVGLDQKTILVAYNKVKDNGDPEIYFDVWKSE